MQKCIKLARNGEGKVSPNPLVGCVVLDKNGNEIATGYHHQYGKNHAERDALLKLQNKEAEGGTLIVNLEPCSHYGKTPPCTDLIIERGIKKVVIGMRDVNPKVNGIKILQDAGIEVVENVLESECRKLNEIFIKNMTQNKPFIALKTAATLDGKIAAANGSSKWITSENARNEVKIIRNRYDAILTTSATILADNPTMEHKKKIILDRELKTNSDAKIYKNGECYIFHSPNAIVNDSEAIQLLENLPHTRISSSQNSQNNFLSPLWQEKLFETPVINNKLDLEFVFNKAYELGIKSILIEAGGHLNGEALRFTDKIYHFIAPKITGDNKSRSCFDFRQLEDINNCINFKIHSVENFEPDILLTYYPLNR